METVDTDVFWSRVVDAPDCFGELQATDAAWHERAVVVWRVVGETLVQREGNDMLVAAWEENLGLEPVEGDGVPARKAAVLQRLCDMGLPVTVACLEAELARRIGEGMAGVSLSGGTLTVSVALDTTEEQIAEVQKLLDRVLPNNLVTEMEWADGLPITYTRVEYLEGNANAYIDSEFLPTDETEIRAVLYFTPNSYVETHTVSNKESTLALKLAPDTYIHWGSVKAKKIGNLYKPKFKGELVFRRGYASYGDRQATFDCDSFAENPATNSVLINTKSRLQMDATGMNRWYDCRIYENGTEQRAYIPALDPTGAPCMFDLVTREPFYNSGTGDFFYPGKEEEATTYSLRRPLTYAHATAHGIRRLYHVPAGYNGTREEYAAEHGYKVLLETPEPEEGYWSPVWHETEEEIVLEWVETEPPAEGEGLISDSNE